MNEPDLSQLKDYEYPDIAKRFFRETRNHKLEIKHDDGLYRHIRMMDPKNSSYWFDLITWPSNLVFRGDGESFAFTRLEDMFEFFRSGLYKDGSVHINPGYWSEKLTSSRGKEKVFSEERLKAVILERLEEVIECKDFTEAEKAELREAVNDEIFEDDAFTSEDCAYGLVESFEFKYGPKDRWGDGTRSFTFGDVWDWFGASKDYDWWLLWAMYAIVRGIQAYDIAKGHGPVQDTALAVVTEVPVYNITSLGRDISRQGVIVG